MKFLGILAVLAIIYLVAAQLRTSNSATKSSFAEAESEASKVDPRTQPAPAATPATAGASMRRPLDRARELNGVVKQRNGAGEF